MIRLAVRVSDAHAELVLAELLELAPAGVEEVPLDNGGVEYAIYGAPGELPSLHDLDAVVGEAPVEISTSEIPDDWHERWRDFHRPVLVRAPSTPTDPVANARRVPDLYIRPPWEQPSDTGGEAPEEIVIDPGQAFGTGGHASTQLCLGLLLELSAQDDSHGALLDLGTGSGVLAIAAARLGFQPVLALDHDLESVQAAAHNALANAVQVDVERFDLRYDELPWNDGARSGEPIVMLANLLRPLLLDLAEALARPPAHLIAGGLLCEEADEIAAAFNKRLGMHERARRRSGEWAGMWLSAP